MGHSKTALNWLAKQLGLDRWVPDTTGEPYKQELGRKFEALLKSDKVKEKDRTGLQAVMDQKVFDLRSSEKNLPDVWLDIRRNIRTPSRKIDRDRKLAEKIFREQGGDYKKTLIELKRTDVGDAVIDKYEKGLRKQQNVFINRLRKEIERANTKEEVRKLKDTVQYEVQKEKAKPSDEQLLTEKTLNHLLRKYQEKRNQYFNPRGKGVEVARTSIVREYKEVTAPTVNHQKVEEKTQEILYEQPWLGKRAADQEAEKVVRREAQYHDYLEAMRKRKQGEISAYDLVLQKYATQNNDPVLSLFDKENLLRQFETKNGKAIKNPRITRTNRIDPSFVPDIRKRLEKEVATERSRYEKFLSGIKIKRLTPRFQAASVSPVISVTPEERALGIRTLQVLTKPKKPSLLAKSPAREAALKKLNERNKQRTQNT